jgi:hypothetical protein
MSAFSHEPAPPLPAALLKAVPGRFADKSRVTEKVGNRMIRDVLTIAIVAFAISFVAITEVMLSLM